MESTGVYWKPIYNLLEADFTLLLVNAQHIGALPGAELVSEPRVNQGIVRFLAPDVSATEADHDRRTDAMIGAILATGEAFFSGTS